MMPPSLPASSGSSRPHRHSFAAGASRLAALTMGMMAFGALSCAADPTSYTITLAEEMMLVPEGGLGLHGWPDQGFAPLASASGLRAVTAAADGVSYLLTGADLGHLDTATPVLMPGMAGSFDAGYAGLGAVYAAPDGTLYGYYEGQNRDDIVPFANGLPGYYAEIALATSTDNGLTWTKVGPVITSDQKKTDVITAKASAGGVSGPAVAPSPDGRYLYLYFADHSGDSNRGVQICLARADLMQGAPLPGQFVKRNGTDFIEPGLGGPCVPVINGIGFDYADTLQPNVVYSTFAKRYFATFVVHDWYSLDNQDGLGYTGLAYAISEDGINWTSPLPLLRELVIPTVGAPIAAHGSIVWDDAEQQTGWLLYGASLDWGSADTGHHPPTLVGRRLKVVKH